MEDYYGIKSRRAREYIRSLPFKKKIPFKQMFPKTSDLALDLLEKLLAFNPVKRITVDEALQHPYLEPYHDPEDEPTAAPIPEEFFDFDKNKDNLSKEQRIELVSMVDRDGLFQARNSVKLVATAMKISRASVYNLLAETSKQPHAKARSPVKKGKPNGHSAGAAPGPASELNGAAIPIPAPRGRAGSAISRRGSPRAKQASNPG